MARSSVAKLTHLIAPATLVLALVASSGAARPAEIQLLSVPAMQTVFKEIAGSFARASGHKLTVRYATMGAITRRVRSGESADLIVGPTQSILALMKEGHIEPDSQQPICKTGIGIVVPTFGLRVLVRNIEDFKQELLAAKTVVYADPGGDAAGIHIASVIERLGLAEQLKPKTVFSAGGDVTDVTLAQGTGALGMTQISEIVGKWGAQYVGPLPKELQNYTGVAAGIPTGAEPSEAVMAFLGFMQGPVAIAAIRAKGMEVD
jgi:molybdate transport system substrate-binding protein